LAAARTHWPAWTCLNAGNLKALPLLAGVEALTIACDHDPAGIAAALEAGARWHAGGREVQVLYPAKAGDDWADVGVAGEATGS
jgi:putative DNA primase/helicase